MNKATHYLANDVRAMIEPVSPEFGVGRSPKKRVVGEDALVHVDIFSDGQNQFRGLFRRGPADSKICSAGSTAPNGHDHWQPTIHVPTTGRHEYSTINWADRCLTGHHNLARRKVADGYDLRSEMNNRPESLFIPLVSLLKRQDIQ